MVKSNKDDDSKVCLQDFLGPNSSSLNIKWFVCFFFFSQYREGTCHMGIL